MEYKINRSDFDFSYTPFNDSINVGISPKVYEQLTNEQVSNYISDSFTHEYIHSLLYRIFGSVVTKLFDTRQQYFRNTELHEKIIKIHRTCYSSSGKITHHAFIKEYGINVFLARYGITSDDVRNASLICSLRKELI